MNPDVVRENRELHTLRAQVAAVRALAERAVVDRHHLGWSVERPDGSGVFGTFDRIESAQRCLVDIQRGICPDAHIVDYYAPSSVDPRLVLAALDGAS